MKWMLTLILTVLASTAVLSQKCIAQDSLGLIVEIKEKYGCLLIDTCTVLMQSEGNFVLVKKNLPSAWFPTSFHSVRVIGRLQDTTTTTKIKKEVGDESD